MPVVVPIAVASRPIDVPPVYMHVLAIRQGHISQFEGQARSSFHAAGLHRLHHAASHNLPAARHYETVCDQRLG
jgi:hypothetical protein